MAQSQGPPPVTAVSPEHLEALREYDQLDGKRDSQVAEAFQEIYELLSGYESIAINRYFLEEHADLFDRILRAARLDTLPLDTPAANFNEFTHRYSFFKVDVAPNDDACVQGGQLTFKSMGYSAVYIPPLNFGSLREMTISFFFTIESLGEADEVQKRFGFKMGSVEVYFVAECDQTGIAQFRSVYIVERGQDENGQDEPTIKALEDVCFLEGELMKFVLQAHQDKTSCLHICKETNDATFALDLELNRRGFCHPSTRSTNFLGIFIEGGIECEKSFSIESISLLQYEEDPSAYQLQQVRPELRERAIQLLDLIRPFLRSAQTEAGVDGRAQLLQVVFQVLSSSAILHSERAA